MKWRVMDLTNMQVERLNRICGPNWICIISYVVELKMLIRLVCIAVVKKYKGETFYEVARYGHGEYASRVAQ